MPAGDITLYARWDRAYTVTFDANGEGGTAPATKTVIAGSSLTFPDSGGLTSRYTFSGWNVNTYGTGANYSAGSSFTPTENITFYARWYSTITYNANGRSGYTMPPPSQNILKGTSITLPSVSSSFFLGWSDGSVGGYTYPAGFSYTPTGNITLYAIWTDY
jgi:hypothetical protein